MASDLLDSRALRCPACAAAQRPGAPWCTQCFQDLRPAAPLAEPVDAPPFTAAEPSDPAAESGDPGDPVAEPSDPAATGLLPAAEPDPAQDGPLLPAGWPCAACGARTPLDEDDCAGCGQPFLSQVREAEPPLLVLPGVGDVARLSRRQLAAAAAGAVLALSTLGLLLGLVIR